MCGGSESSKLGAQPAGACQWGAVCGAGRPLRGLRAGGGPAYRPSAERCQLGASVRHDAPRLGSFGARMCGGVVGCVLWLGGRRRAACGSVRRCAAMCCGVAGGGGRWREGGDVRRRRAAACGSVRRRGVRRSVVSRGRRQAVACGRRRAAATCGGAWRRVGRRRSAQRASAGGKSYPWARARVLGRARAGLMRGRAASGRGPWAGDGTAGVSGAALNVRAGSADDPGARRSHWRRARSGTRRGQCVYDQLCVRLAALRCSAVSRNSMGWRALLAEKVGWMPMIPTESHLFTLRSWQVSSPTGRPDSHDAPQRASKILLPRPVSTSSRWEGRGARAADATGAGGGGSTPPPHHDRAPIPAPAPQAAHWQMPRRAA